MLFPCITFHYLLALCLLHIIEISSVQEIVARPISLIYFYAPDCQYCLAFSEDFEYLSYLYNSETDFQIVQVNGRENKYLKELFDVNYFPTLKLYDDLKKKVVTFTEIRLVINLQKFIKENTQIEPDTNKSENKIASISTKKEIDEIKKRKESVLIAFVDKQDKTWANYYYPMHFYQALARRSPDIEFTLKFMEDGGFELMETYHVSNTPSLVLVDGNHIGIHNTLSTNQMTNYKLEAEDVETFLSDFRAKKEGTWFKDSDSLSIFAENSRFVGHVQRKPGMNYVESQVTGDLAGLGLEEQYQILLDNINL